MLAAHEQSDKNLTSLVEEIYRLVSGAAHDDRVSRRTAGPAQNFAEAHPKDRPA